MADKIADDTAGDHQSNGATRAVIHLGGPDIQAPPADAAPRPRVSSSASGALTGGARVGLALGGGGARGLAHISILEAFDELGIRPSVIAGTSIGAIYGAAYASGMTGAQIREMTLQTLGSRMALIRQMFGVRSEPIGRLFRVLPRRSALLNAEAVVDLVLPTRMPRTFEQLATPLHITATDMATHRGCTISSGDLPSAVAASIAIPVLFSPVPREDALLLDGGLVNPCPYDLLLDQCDTVVAIDVSGAASEATIGPSPSAIEIMVQSTQILQKSITRERIKFRPPDLYLEVDLDRFGALEFYKAREVLAAAEPIKQTFKARLARLLGAETLPVPVS
ncbi:MAG: patatin-like phospholipase family protein [Pseudomonadota bacterium]